MRRGWLQHVEKINCAQFEGERNPALLRRFGTFVASAETAILLVRIAVHIRRSGRSGLSFEKHEPAMSKLKDIEWLFNGRHFNSGIIVLCVRRCLRYKLSLRVLVEMMAERGLHSRTPRRKSRGTRRLCAASDASGTRPLRSSALR